jgi:tRNA dimethylallyltransferase
MALAGLVPSEIIAADSRTIYKDMDIGTAKSSLQELRQVPHWGLDLLDPGEVYSAKNFQAYALQKIQEIKGRDRLPILVGGTGLYVDSVLYDFEFTAPASENRLELEKLTLEELQQLILEQQLPMPENRQNKRHLIRTVERQGKTGARQPLRPHTLLVGLWPDDMTLRANIDRRAEEMFAAGITQETERLLKKYGEKALLATGGIIYKICIQVIAGKITEQTAITLFKTADWQYARRQRTWFKRNKDIVWFENRNKALLHLRKTLNT